jgi:aspartyl-tRNA synthetase
VGKVRLRSVDAINPKMPTGEIEIEATQLLVLNDSRLAPFSPSEEAIQNEEVRLKYRYVDLRRPEMQRNFRLRHDITLAIRDNLSQQGFLEIETPILTKSPRPRARAIFWCPAACIRANSSRCRSRRRSSSKSS